MDNYRLDIEELILACFLNQDKCSDLDKCEFEAYIIPYQLFEATRTTKLIAKAIFNLQEEKTPISDITVLCYIEKHTTFNEHEVLSILTKLWCTFDTMEQYIEQLKKIDEEENKLRILEEM